MQQENYSSGAVLFVCNPDRTHVGHHLIAAARELTVPHHVLDVRLAMGQGLRQRLWWKLGRMPLYRKRFNRLFREQMQEHCPALVICVGIVPLSASSVKMTNARVVNFLTDDPWNPAHWNRMFMAALPHYSHVFSPRRSNLDDLARAHVSASFLPFAFSPLVHFFDPQLATGNQQDVLFVGGADDDRVPFISAMLHQGLDVKLIGAYWDRYAETRQHTIGKADERAIRDATQACKVSLVLVRRANRDGHVMRSLEAAASGGCVLAEDTAEHRALFGDDGGAARYFSSPEQAAQIAAELVSRPDLRRAMIEHSLTTVATAKNTYSERLREILKTCYPADQVQQRTVAQQ